MTTKTVSAAVPADVKTEAAAISMAAFVRELPARVAARDAETLAWLDEVRRWPIRSAWKTGCMRRPARPAPS